MADAVLAIVADFPVPVLSGTHSILKHAETTTAAAAAATTTTTTTTTNKQTNKHDH